MLCGCCKHIMQKHKKETVFECFFTRVDENAECYGLNVPTAELETMIFDVVSKQANLISKNKNTNYIAELKTQYAQKSEYEKLIQDCIEEKCKLYEQYFSKSIELNYYMEQKAVCDVELQKLTQIHSSITAEIEKTQMEYEARKSLLDLSTVISEEHNLTQDLASTLIDKVYVYPNDRIEIVWATQDFFAENIF